MAIRLRFQECLQAKRLRDKVVDDTYPEMAHQMGLSPRMVFDLYHGRWSKLAVIEAMCRYLGCTPGELLVLEPDKAAEKKKPDGKK